MKLILIFALVAPALAQWDPYFVGNRTTIVHLFEWTWNEIGEECETFLGPMGYGGVQTSPVTENALFTNPFRPWWERYQPVSYNVLTTRSGTEEEFSMMVRRCNAAGVRVYVDAVINHMTADTISGVGTGGSSFDATTKTFPEYSWRDFNGQHNGKCLTPSGKIDDYNDINQVRNCELRTQNENEGLVDLDQGTDYVRGHTADLLNKLIRYGVAGFRLDASKHMWPADIEGILANVTDLSTNHGFPPNSRPFIYQEVIESASEPIKGHEYFYLGRVTEFKAGLELGRVFRGGDRLKELVNWGEGSEGWGLYPDNNSLLFVDNHDNQRGHGGGGDLILTFRQDKLYKMATAFMLARPYGVTRVMSSYFWEQRWEGGRDMNDWIGPPSNETGHTLPIIRNPDYSCGNNWICEHRWRQIYNLVRFRNVAVGTGVDAWWDNGNNQIAFSRRNPGEEARGFIAINGDNHQLNQKLQTFLPEGRYCDVISGNKEGDLCTGKEIIVEADGTANIVVSHEPDSDDWDPIVAIHVEAKL